MRLLLKIITVVLLLLVIASIVAFFYINHIVKAGIEYGATYALGVKTTLSDVDIGILRGQSSISQLDIANPEGFESEHFLKLGRGYIEVKLRALLKENVEIPKLRFDDIDLYLEKQGAKSNYDIILENLSRFEKSDTGVRENSKQFVIRELEIRNIKVTVDLLPAKGKLTRQEIIIPEIKMTDIGSETDKGVVVADLTGIVLKSVLKSVVEKGVDLPGDILKELDKGLEGLGSVGKYGIEVLGDVQTKVLMRAGETVGAMTEKLGEAADKAGKTVEGLFEGLGDALRNDKDAE